MRKFKSLISLLLLVIFLFPTVVKIEHHHEHFVCHAKTEKHLHEKHENCQICKFEFSLFTEEYQTIKSHKEEFNILYFEYFQDCNICNKSQYSFLLRAPPVLLT